MDDALFDIGTILFIAGFMLSLKFGYHIIKNNVKKAKTEFILMLIMFSLGLICRHYRYVEMIILSLGELCILVSGLLLVLAFVAVLFLIIKAIASKCFSVLQKCKHIIEQKRDLKRETTTKHKRLIRIRRQRKNKTLLPFDIPDDSFFEVPLPPGGLE